MSKMMLTAICVLSVGIPVSAISASEPQKPPAAATQSGDLISLDPDHPIVIADVQHNIQKPRCTCYGAIVTPKTVKCTGPNNTIVYKIGRCYAKKNLETGKPCIPVCDSDFNVCTGSLAPGCQ